MVHLKAEASQTAGADKPVTWCTCPRCGHHWRALVPTPGVVHQTICCTACRKLAYAKGDD
jgi:hypothetical protein